MLLMEREDGIKLLSIESADDMLPFRASFAGAYQTVFADPPYQERIYPTEALAVIQQHLSIEGQITVIAVQGEMSVIGFGMACPLHRRPDIVKQLRVSSDRHTEPSWGSRATQANGHRWTAHKTSSRSN